MSRGAWAVAVGALAWAAWRVYEEHREQRALEAKTGRLKDELGELDAFGVEGEGAPFPAAPEDFR